MFSKIFSSSRAHTPRVGIDISPEAIHFIVFTKNERGGVAHFASKPLIEAAIIRGDIKNERSIATALSTIKHQRSLKAISGTLPDDKAHLFRIAVPSHSEQQTKLEIARLLKTQVPISLGEVVFTHSPVMNAPNKGLREMAVTVFPRTTIESWSSLYRKNGLTPQSLTLRAGAIVKAVVPKHDTATVMIVDIGNRHVSISIVSNHLIESLVMIDTEIGLSSEKKMLSFLSDEIDRRYLEWHKKETRRQKIKKVLLVGDSPHIESLASGLSLSLRLPVQPANVWVNVASFDDYIPPIPREESYAYAAAIGCAL